MGTGPPASQGAAHFLQYIIPGSPHNYLIDWNSSLGPISVHQVNDMFSNGIFTRQRGLWANDTSSEASVGKGVEAAVTALLKCRARPRAPRFVFGITGDNKVFAGALPGHYHGMSQRPSVRQGAISGRWHPVCSAAALCCYERCVRLSVGMSQDSSPMTDGTHASELLTEGWLGNWGNRAVME